MNKQKAISILKKQIVKLEDVNNFHESWIIQTNSYLSAIFGPTSKQSSFFDNYFFQIHLYSSQGTSQIEIDKEYENLVAIQNQKAVNFLNECIDTIYDIDVYKSPPQGNFISRMPEKWAVPLFIGIISASFYLGTIVCKIP